MFQAKEVAAPAMTECTQDGLEFESHFSRQVVARFDGGALTSDAGALLLRETDRRIRLIERLAACFDDHRDPALVRHPVQEMVAQRVYRSLKYDRWRVREDISATC
jgi:hypothetical protein